MEFGVNGHFRLPVFIELTGDGYDANKENDNGWFRELIFGAFTRFSLFFMEGADLFSATEVVRANADYRCRTWR